MSDDIKILKAEIKRLRKTVSRLTTSLDTMLRRRGFTIYKKEPGDDLLKPYRAYASAFYRNMKKYSFRIFLRDVIKRQESFTLEQVTKYSTRDVSAKYLDFLLRSGLVEQSGKNYRLSRRPVKSFGETLEWFVSRIMKNDFDADTVWGVKFRKREVGGDYDLISRVDSMLLYMEIKSSPPKQINDSEITAFLDRVEDLSPDIAVFFVDTELRMKDKIVPMFGDELRRRYNKSIPVRRIHKELFHINRKIFIINAKGSITSNIETVLTFIWHNEFKIT
jgi:hypothetical protein